MGRYVTQDPIGWRGGENWYTYPFNPNYQFDPFGLFAIVGWFLRPAIPKIAKATSAALLGIAGALGLSALNEKSEDRFGRQIDPQADLLSKGHAAAAGNRADPRYGGNCTPDEYDELEKNKKSECSKTDQLGKCKRDMDNGMLHERMVQFGRCAKAREKVMDKCFAGGDYGHIKQLNEQWEGANKCAVWMK